MIAAKYIRRDSPLPVDALAVLCWIGAYNRIHRAWPLISVLTRREWCAGYLEELEKMGFVARGGFNGNDKTGGTVRLTAVGMHEVFGRDA